MGKNLLTDVAHELGRDKKDVTRLLDALAQAIIQTCGEMDNVAIPGFGTFEPVKHEEQIMTDRSTGGQLLLPPEIVLTFKPASKLKRTLEHE